MKTLIVYAHPWDGSFNHHVLGQVKELLAKKNHEIDVIDLNKDGFNPVMRPEDLKVFVKGEYADEKAADYVKRVKEADELVFIFPIWWYGEPAILKGFYDKVFLKGQVYGEVDHQLKGLLKSERATIITTANIDKKIFSFLGDPIQNVLANGILRTVGINNVTWIHCPTVHVEESRNNFLAEINTHFNK
ncbi:Flavodoxin-like fold domain protein [Alteracholeplasma palmae J233]|uniref:Flavodoxin-like fold domain protein n=1 Tax=Alteracholeplasma palmae (strain ATCC 49389 / J233) TaxID=1318466 RepID=U4KQH5_ALTPJ|nr:NAD(P)H-dependent oxidoreductase [Alteracholeplasma palmae]CCV64590.1 Flavodoxin-like fold domain protein [Alteracholeplasma palmae J233]